MPKESIVNAEKVATSLKLLSECRAFLRDFTKYIDGEAEIEEVKNLSVILRNSMPSVEAKSHALRLHSELLLAEKTIIDWYDEFSDDRNVIVSSFFVLDRRYIGQQRIIKFKITQGRNAGETITYDHDVSYCRNIKYLESLKCWRKYGRYSSTSRLPKWVNLIPHIA